MAYVADGSTGYAPDKPYSKVNRVLAAVVPGTTTPQYVGEKVAGYDIGGTVQATFVATGSGNTAWRKMVDTH